MIHKFFYTWQQTRLWFFVGLLALYGTSCSTLKSDLTVRPGVQFELGGNQNGPFTVEIKNTGNVPVTITERKAAGQDVALGILSPGVQQKVQFSSGSAVLIENQSGQPARLFLTVTGDKNLSMAERAK